MKTGSVRIYIPRPTTTELTREQMELYTPTNPHQAADTRRAVREINRAVAEARRLVARRRHPVLRSVREARIWVDMIEPVLEAHRKTGAHDTASREAIWDAFRKR